MLRLWFMAGHATTRFGLMAVGCLLIAGGSPASAQEITLPDVEALFTDAVEVTFVQPIPNPANNLIYLYEDGGWYAIENPEPERRIATNEVENTPQYAIYPRPDDSYLFVFAVEEGPYAEVEWAVLKEGQFTPPVTEICPSTEANRPITVEWTIVVRNERRYFCSIISGDLSTPFPSNLIFVTEPAPAVVAGSIKVSPDGRYVLVFTPTREDVFSNPPLITYSYEFTTGDWRYLGQWQPRYVNYPEFTWITNTDFMYRMDEMQEWSTNYIIVGDVSQEDSIQEGLGTTRFPPLVVENPSGLEAHYAVRHDGNHFHSLCYEDFYNAQENTIQTYRVDYLCEYGLPIADGSGDFLFRRADPYGALVRRNLLLGTQQVLYRGAFESLGPVSPNGRWGLVEIAADRTLEYELDDEFPPYSDALTPFQVMDLTTGTLMGEIPSHSFWLSDNTLLDGTTLYRIDEINEQILSLQLPGEPEYVAPDRGQALLWDEGLWLYDAEADDSTLLMTLPSDAHFDLEPIPSSETIRISWLNPPNSPAAFVFDLHLPGEWRYPPYPYGFAGPEARYQ
jgi:hypothetical protein